LALDAIEDAAGQRDALAVDGGEGAHRERSALVVVEVAPAELEHPPAVDVARVHEAPQLVEHRLCALLAAGHRLDLERLATAVVGALEHEDERLAVLVVDQPHRGAHAADVLVRAERHGDVLDAAELDVGHPLTAADQLGQPGAVAVLDGEPQDLAASGGEPGVEATVRFGRSQGASGRPTTGSSAGSAPKWMRRR